jgi:hypothetical protein
MRWVQTWKEEARWNAEAEVEAEGRRWLSLRLLEGKVRT